MCVEVILTCFELIPIFMTRQSWAFLLKDFNARVERLSAFWMETCRVDKLACISMWQLKRVKAVNWYRVWLNSIGIDQTDTTRTCTYQETSTLVLNAISYFEWQFGVWMSIPRKHAFLSGDFNRGGRHHKNELFQANQNHNSKSNSQRARGYASHSWLYKQPHDSYTCNGIFSAPYTKMYYLLREPVSIWLPTKHTGQNGWKAMDLRSILHGDFKVDLG